MKKRNLFLLPSTLAVFLMVLPTLEDKVNKTLDSGKVDPKDVVALLFTLTTLTAQTILRYYEQEDGVVLYTPKGLPGKDKDDDRFKGLDEMNP